MGSRVEGSQALFGIHRVVEGLAKNRGAFQLSVQRPGPIPGTSVPATTGSGGVAGALMPPGPSR